MITYTFNKVGGDSQFYVYNVKNIIIWTYFYQIKILMFTLISGLEKVNYLRVQMPCSAFVLF